MWEITETLLEGCFILESKVFRDDRGLFYESYRKKILESVIGHQIHFVQDNHSISKKGVLRGLHFQTGAYAQAKLVRVIKGEVLDVVVDLRRDSATFGRSFKQRLSEDNFKSIFIPKGMAHGFLTLSEEAVFTYKCDSYYSSDHENGIIFSDEDLGIDWEYPKDKIILSYKDKELPKFKNYHP